MVGLCGSCPDATTGPFVVESEIPCWLWVTGTDASLCFRLRKKRNAMRKANRQPPTNAPTIPPARAPVLYWPLDEDLCELLAEGIAVAFTNMLVLEAGVVVDNIEEESDDDCVDLDPGDSDIDVDVDDDADVDVDVDVDGVDEGIAVVDEVISVPVGGRVIIVNWPSVKVEVVTILDAITKEIGRAHV